MKRSFPAMMVLRDAALPVGVPRHAAQLLRTCVAAALCIAIAVIAPRPAVASPRVVRESPLSRVPGQIIAWQDTTYLSVSLASVRQVIHHVNVASGKMADYAVGKTGRGVLVGMSPDARTFLAVEPDSQGLQLLQYASSPYFQWKPLFPVTDADPHVTWYPNGRAFLYQDILDDSAGTPSVFHFQLGNTGTPKLFLVGGQRPLLAPTGDAVICVGTDSLNPGPTRDIEQRQPVGMEDLQVGGFRWVAPLQTHVPKVGAWSSDGNRLALVGYGIGERKKPERRVYIYSRRTGQSKKIVLPGDFTRSDGDHSMDVAVWSPDGQWIAVTRPKAPDRSKDRGAVWLINREGSQVFELKPKSGTWQGVPLWVAPDQFIIGDGSPPPGSAVLGRAWIVQVAM